MYNKAPGIVSNLLIRADASLAIGSGHLMRCLALAQAWHRAGGTAKFACAACPETLFQRIKNDGVEVHRLIRHETASRDEAIELASLAADERACWVVIDGYQFDREYCFLLKKAGLHVLAVDDYGHTADWDADIVLNQNVGAEAVFGANGGSLAHLLFGPRYALLRREFGPWRDWRRKVSPVGRKVLLTMGGMDAENVTGKVMQAVKGLSGLEVSVVVGENNPHIASLQSMASLLSAPAAIFKLHVNPTDMPGLMAEADIAVTPASSTSLEMFFMQVPQIMIPYAQNQMAGAGAAAAAGAAINMGACPDVGRDAISEAVTLLLGNLPQRSNMAERGRELVDGNGSDRVVDAIWPRNIFLRRGVGEDARLFWIWANEPKVRENAFSGEAIQWDDHVRWFSKKMEDPDCELLIASDSEGRPVGHIRFDICGNCADITISIIPSRRGLGLGEKIIRQGMRFVEGDRSASLEFHAYVKPSNVPSLRTFQRAGFNPVDKVKVRDQDAFHLLRAQGQL